MPGLRRGRQSADLHRKETFPLHGSFARLTAQEQKHSLLADPISIGTREGWQRRLAAAGFTFRGHRLIRV